MNLHAELERKYGNTIPGLIHIVNHLAEILGVIKGTIGAVDFLVGVFKTGVGKRG